MAKGDGYLLAYGAVAIGYRITTIIGIVFITLAIISLPVIYVLDNNHKLPCSWVKGQFAINNSYYQGYEKRCVESWRSGR